MENLSLFSESWCWRKFSPVWAQALPQRYKGFLQIEKKNCFSTAGNCLMFGFKVVKDSRWSPVGFVKYLVSRQSQHSNESQQWPITVGRQGKELVTLEICLVHTQMPNTLFLYLCICESREPIKPRKKPPRKKQNIYWKVFGKNKIPNIMNKCEYYNLPLLIVPNYCRLFCGGGFLKILFLGKEEKQSVKHFLSSILNKGTLQ